MQDNFECTGMPISSPLIKGILSQSRKLGNHACTGQVLGAAADAFHEWRSQSLALPALEDVLSYLDKCQKVKNMPVSEREACLLGGLH